MKVIADKTRGHCPDCFRSHASEIIDAVMVVASGRERVVLRPKRSPTELAARKRAKQKPEVKARAKLVEKCNQKATQRLRHLYPEIWEVLVADERAKAGLEAWTLDRVLTPGDAESSLEALSAYYHVDQESTNGSPHPSSTAT